MKQILEMFGEPITYGGQENVVYNMLSFLYSENTNYDIDLFTPYYADNKQLIDLTNSHNGDIYSLGLKFKTEDIRYFLYTSVSNFFKRNKKYDIVHIHTGSLATMLVYAITAKKSGVKKVIAHSHINIMSAGIIGQIRKYFICKLLKKYVDVFAGCSQEALGGKFTKDIADKGIIINNGIDIDRYKFDEKIRKEYRIKYNVDDKFVVGSLGRVEYQKNNLFMIDVMCELVKKDKDTVLLMVGDGTLLNKAKEKVKEYKLDNNFIFAGNTEEAYKLYQAFDVFIMPSHFESLGITAVEAEVSGLPVLLSDRIPKVTRISTGTEFLSIDNPSIWVSKILEIKNKHHRRNSFTIDFDKFDRNNTYKKIKEIYDLPIMV